MKKLKLPAGVREDFDLLLVGGAGQWWTFEKRFAATFATVWLRLQPGEKDALLKSWAKWLKGKKPQVWVKFVDAFPADASGQIPWTFYEPNGGIFNFAVPPCLAMPDAQLATFIAHELYRALRVAQNVASPSPELEEPQIRTAAQHAGYDEPALQQWIAGHRQPSA